MILLLLLLLIIIIIIIMIISIQASLNDQFLSESIQARDACGQRTGPRPGCSHRVCHNLGDGRHWITIWWEIKQRKSMVIFKRFLLHGALFGLVI